MAPRQRNRAPLSEIDLNVDFVDHRDKEDEEEIQSFDFNNEAEESIFHSFDLNNEAEEFIFDDEVAMEDELDMEDDEVPMEDDEHMEVGSQLQQTNFNPDIELSSHRTKLRNLRNDEHRAIYDMLLQKSIDGKLKKGTTKLVASLFSISIRTVQRIWKKAKANDAYVDVSHKRTKNCGRKRIQIDLDRFREVPLHQRTTICSLAYAMNMKKSTLFRRVQDGEIRRHTNALKPFLKEEHKISRLRFCISMLEQSSIPHDPIFNGMFNVIHIDEKWFNMTKKTENFYLLPDEEDPMRSCKSKNFIGKVMFLAAIARPRFDNQGNELFSGKIGLFPFVTQEPARRSSINRAAGTIETKPITSVIREVIRSCMIEKVLPAIKEKWPREDFGYPIYIQQDNARTHINLTDSDFCRAAIQDGFDIRLTYQPANSPDLNVLDLGFFNAIQQLQYKEAPRSFDELLQAVVKSFDEYPTRKSNRIFLSLQSCMIEIIKGKGHNKYKIPHIRKEMLERRGELPTQMKCDLELVQEVQNYLNQLDEDISIG